MLGRLVKRTTHRTDTCRRSLASVSISEQPASEISETPTASARSRIRTAVILNRAPTLTTEPTPFESAYYAYHARIHRAIRNPFPSEFYFKQGSPLESTFNALERVREKEAFGSGFGTVAAGQEKVAKAEADAVAIAAEEEEKPLPREHPSDVSGDLQSLDRMGPRNLYLLVATKGGDAAWRFPQGSDGVHEGELLHQNVSREMKKILGDKMDTWIVSRQPIGLLENTTSDTVVFFYKAHILAGQVKSSPTLDFAWLSKEEIHKRVTSEYWEAVKDLLADH